MVPGRTVAVIMSPLTLAVDGMLNNNAGNAQRSVPVAFSARPQDEVNAEDK